MTKRKKSVKRWLYEFGLEEIWHAYESSETSFKDQQAKLSDEWDAYKTQDNKLDDYAEFLADRHELAENAIGTLRGAFVIVLYHYWERSAADWMKSKDGNHGYNRYDADKAYKALPEAGIRVDKTGLEKLRKASNCVKHGSDELYRQYPKLFDKSVKEALSRGWTPDYADDIRLSEEIMNEFFSLLNECGPYEEP